MSNEVVALRHVLSEMPRDDLELYAAISAAVVMRFRDKTGIGTVLTPLLPGYTDWENERMVILSERIAESVKQLVSIESN